MPSSASVWFTNGATVIRMDVTDAGVRWSQPAWLFHRFRALLFVGVGFTESVTGAFQPAADELVFGTAWNSWDPRREPPSQQCSEARQP